MDTFLLTVNIFLGCQFDQAKFQLLKSKSAYQDCLKVHPVNSEKCNTLKEIYESDLHAVKVMNPGKQND